MLMGKTTSYEVQARHVGMSLWVRQSEHTFMHYAIDEMRAQRKGSKLEWRLVRVDRTVLPVTSLEDG